MRLNFSSVQSLSHVRLFATPWIIAQQASLSITNSRSLLKLMSIESVMPSSHLIICRPLLLLLPIPPSIRVFSNESTLHMRWPKYWSFSFSVRLNLSLPKCSGSQWEGSGGSNPFPGTFGNGVGGLSHSASPGYLPNPEIEPASPVCPALQADSLPTEWPGKTDLLLLLLLSHLSRVRLCATP